jgi:hypothetical protein
MFTSGIDSGERHSALNPLLEEPQPETVPDWENIGIFAAGITVGIVLGAGAALWFASRNDDEDADSSDSESDGWTELGSDAGWEELARELALAEAELAGR